jgi:MraZ protein
VTRVKVDNSTRRVEAGGIQFHASGRKWDKTNLTTDKTQSTMFIGEYTHTVDEKKRISLPSKFKKELGIKVVVSRGLDNCLFLFPYKTWLQISEEMSQTDMKAGDARGFSRFLFSGAVEVDVDSMGRILVPDFLREFGDIKSTVVFTGVHNRVEIWNEKRWDTYRKRMELEGEAMAEKLASVGIR